MSDQSISDKLRAALAKYPDDVQVDEQGELCGYFRFAPLRPMFRKRIEPHLLAKAKRVKFRLQGGGDWSTLREFLAWDDSRFMEEE